MSSTVFVFLVTVQCMHLAHSTTPKKNFADPNKIKYPGPVQQVSNRYGDGTESSEIPDECKGKTFCTIKPPDYPEERYNSMFKGYKPVHQPTFLPEDSLNRQGDPDELDDCDSNVSYEPLYNVRTDRGVWRTVIQAPAAEFVQRVRLEECKAVNARCFLGVPQIDGIDVFCKQKYTTWEFLVDDGNNGSEKVKTQLPICCSCHYRL